MRHNNVQKNSYTFKNVNEQTEVIIENNTRSNFKKKQINTKTKNNDTMQSDNITRQTLQTQEKLSPKLNKSELIKGIYRGMFSYPKTSRSVESSPYHQYTKQLTEINLMSCNILKERASRKNTYDFSIKDHSSINDGKDSMYSNIQINNLMRDNSPINNSMNESQGYFFRNFSIDKYLVPSSSDSIAINSVKREDSSNTFKFDISRYKAGGSSRTIESGIVEGRESVNERPLKNFGTGRVNSNDPVVKKLTKSNSFRNKKVFDQLSDEELQSRRMIIELIK